MPQTANIQYFSAPGQPFEVIICQNSTISYPLHNHISVYTVGLVLQGSLLLGVGKQTCLCQAGSSFVLPPYQPHFIKAQATYSLLTVCIDKQSLEQQPQPTRRRSWGAPPRGGPPNPPFLPAAPPGPPPQIAPLNFGKSSASLLNSLSALYDTIKGVFCIG